MEDRRDEQECEREVDNVVSDDRQGNSSRATIKNKKTGHRIKRVLRQTEKSQSGVEVSTSIKLCVVEMCFNV